MPALALVVLLHPYPSYLAPRVYLDGSLVECMVSRLLPSISTHFILAPCFQFITFDFSFRMFTLRRSLLASAVGCGSVASFWAYSAEWACHAKGVPVGDPLDRIIIKGYACHPRSAKIAAILMYYNQPFEV